MFLEFSVKNFRTHIETRIPIYDLNIIIGSNNSGKSNFLSAIQHFTLLVRRANPDERNPQEARKLKETDFLPHRHRLLSDKPMEFSCKWQKNESKVEYCLEIFNQESKIFCNENIYIQLNENSKMQKISNLESEFMNLRSMIQKNSTAQEKQIAHEFFRDLASIYYFNFQPALLKGDIKYPNGNLTKENLKIAPQLGKEGGNLQPIIKLVYQNEKAVYDKFVLLLRKFVDSFYGITLKNDTVYWQFDLNKIPPKLEEFPPHVVSDGLLKAAAIALLASMRNPPALIMLEEIENGVNQKNIQYLLQWLSTITGGDNSKTQVIATTHSPSILKEFSDDLQKVFYFTLLPKGYKSLATDLNTLLINDVKAGRLEGDIIEKEGIEFVQVDPRELIKLFYMGIIGGI
ncbi:MAG: AAA family ATPase [Candidatus Pacearchaeota archaeon]